MNSVVIPSQNNRLLTPSEALAVLQKLDGAEAQDDVEVSSSHWFGLHLSQSEQNGASLGLLIREDCNKELIEEPSICQVPFTPTWLLGFTNVRGQITPVVNPYDFFHLEDSDGQTAKTHSSISRQSDSSYILYFDHEGDSFAIAIHHMPRKFSVNSKQAMSHPPILTAELKACVDTCYHQEGIWCEWNLAKFKRRLTQMLTPS
ncbi:chemotaxis protein CheW [Hahella ganghwensis]|uniref:chemotaxis protein CheW n=1 Tax=Hahella ganghwensis TaxID=286420 RepID=UPI00037023B1|nr:chemotaxis protein CheW [Hahella ganghwensis]